MEEEILPWYQRILLASELAKVGIEQNFLLASWELFVLLQVDGEFVLKKLSQLALILPVDAPNSSNLAGRELVDNDVNLTAWKQNLHRIFPEFVDSAAEAFCESS